MKFPRSLLAVFLTFVGVLQSVSLQAQRQATATPTVFNGFLVAITVTDGGSGYVTAPTVTITGGNGSGAIAAATILNGTVNQVIVQNAGSGYSSTPTVIISPPSVVIPFNYTTNNGKITITKFTGPGGAVLIPGTINGLSVAIIGDRAFTGCTNLASITIPNSVKSIGLLVFEGCTSLASITIPNSVTSIDHAAFSGCNSLTSITIPNSVINLGNGAFRDCTSLTSINIPNSVTNIGSSMFYSCTSLATVTIGNSVTSIGESAFGAWVPSWNRLTLHETKKWSQTGGNKV